MTLEALQRGAACYELECPVMHYDWGKVGAETLINQLRRKNGQTVEPDRPTAELWMGAHKSAPSLVRLPGGKTRPLHELIAEDPAHFLGPHLAAKRKPGLPFLMKILEAARPLSIQAHPDKRRAEILHARDPENYPDNNHKPELAVCLRDLRALIGFRHAEAVHAFFRLVPELGELCSGEFESFDAGAAVRPELLNKEQKRSWLKANYQNLMNATPVEIQEAARAHRLRLDSYGLSPEQMSIEDRLFVSLLEQFGDRDPGIFSVFFLNYAEVPEGRALFLRANEPHAYLEGDVLECMAESDNVVRAGLTSKFRDTNTLIEMLDYESGPPRVLGPRSLNEHRESYRVPVSDFALSRLQFRTSEPLVLKEYDRPGILLVYEGDLNVSLTGTDGSSTLERGHYPAGSVLFLPGDLAHRKLILHLNANTGTVVFEATVGPEF
ncbi:MAG: mannose-6-phosphate isomerase, class I [Leptospiraceae bacterium]|nr:mannose-6-phosphate isomerase, class I [Leptospiraceae bacterium]MCP5485208.1 mannose-6-phosphate isomerase, class I [Spirochaetales bacterium]